VKEYEGLWFYLKDEDGEAEVIVEDAKFDGDVEILELVDGQATVVVSFSFEFTAEASFADPDMQSYDSETGEPFSWGTSEETVRRRGRARTELSVCLKGLTQLPSRSRTSDSFSRANPSESKFTTAPFQVARLGTPAFRCRFGRMAARGCLDGYTGHAAGTLRTRVGSCP